MEAAAAADKLARRCAAAMWESDLASRELQMVLEDVQTGCARLSMQVREQMVNGHGVCHGGYIATFADGASGIVALGRGLGADDRVVTIVQYLRVVLVLLTMPVVTAVVSRTSAGHGSELPGPSATAGRPGLHDGCGTGRRCDREVHPADPAADHRPPVAGPVLGRAEVAPRAGWARGQVSYPWVWGKRRVRPRWTTED